MADKKISALAVATTPLVGTEVLPIVQSNSTVKVPVSDLTVGRDVAAQSITVNKLGMTSYASFGQFPESTTYGQVNFNGATTLGGLSGLIGGGSSGTMFLNVPTGGTLNLLNGGGFVLQLGATDVTLSVGNLIQGTSGKGINFTANTSAAGMTSQLLNRYEEGIWTPIVTALSGTITSYTSSGTYTRIGKTVTATFKINIINNGTGAGALYATLPFNSSSILCIGSGRENAVVGGMLQLITVASDPRVTIYTYNNFYPAGTGYEILATIIYFV